MTYFIYIWGERNKQKLISRSAILPKEPLSNPQQQYAEGRALC